MIQPGSTELTRMLCSPRSRASDRVRPWTADFAVVYPGMPPWPMTQDTEPILTMAPPPALAMPFQTAWAQKNWWRKLIAIRSSQYSGVTESIEWRSSWAALLINTVIAPRAATMVAARGAITVLINNAAHDERHSIDSVTPEYWDERMAINLRHQFFCAQAVWKGMASAGGGAIVNMGSVSWVIGQGGMPGYTTAKSAVQGLTRSLARDLGEHNIRVNSVLPGWIMTRRQMDLWLTPEGEAELMERQCLKRKLQPDDIARVVLFFASEQSGACTNQSYIADGGWV